MQRSTPLSVLAPLLLHRRLVLELTRREIRIRHQATFAGILWPVLQPLLMLAVFAFVFGEIMRVKWGTKGGTVDFALVLFCGLTVFNLFADCMQRAPTLVVGRPNLVKKIVFPLEVLAWVSVAQALFYFSMSIVVLLVFVAIVHGGIQWTTLWLPLIVLPVIFAAVGASWIIAATAVFVRDVAQIVPLAVTALLFLSPVFFDLSQVPQGFRTLFALNPLAPSIEQARAAVLDGRHPDVAQLGVGVIVAFLFAQAGLWFFHRAREDFSDAL